MGRSDEALMENLRRGDMQAFDELYKRHRQPLFNFICRLLQDAALAEDVFQETYMRVLENADRFKPRSKFSTWLYTVAHNLCMDELRRQKGTLTKLLETVPEDLLQPIQRTTLLLPAVIGGYRGRTSLSSLDWDIIPKHLIISTEPYLHLAPSRPVEMTRVKDGLIAVAVSTSASRTLHKFGDHPISRTISRILHKSGDHPIYRLERIRLVRNITVAVVMLGSLILFWLSIPAWMALDAQKRRERAAAWGLFGLLGNMIALVVYLLVRESEHSAPEDASE